MLMNRIMNLRIKKTNIYVYFFIILITIYYSIQNTALYFFDAKLLLYFSLILTGICIAFKPLKLGMPFMYITIVIIFGISTWINSGSYLIVIAVVIFTCKEINKENLLMIIFGVKILILLLGIVTRVYGSNNSTSLFVGILMLTYMVFNRQYINNIKLYILFILDIALYIITNCGSGLICITTSILLLWGIRFKFMKRFLISKIIEWIYPVMFFVTYITALSKNTNKIPFIGDFIGYNINQFFISIIDIVDKITSYRISLNEVTYHMFRISWWGSDIDKSIIKYGYYYLDSGYFSLLYDSGILITIIFMIMSIMMMKFFIKNENYSCIIAAIAIALWAFNEPILLSINMNFMIFYWGNIFLKSSRKNNV